MKKQSLLFTLCYMFLLAAAQTAPAQSTAFTYQGRLTDNSGPANGQYRVRFRLFAGAMTDGGQSLGASTQSVSVVEGLFTARPEFIDNPNLFDGEDRWLEIGIAAIGNPDFFTALVPRQRITPTPTAFYAAKAGGLVAGAPISFGDEVVFSRTTAPPFSVVSSNKVGGLNVDLFDGLDSADYWQLSGNNIVAGKFLGTVNNQPLELKVNNSRALRLEPAGGRPNIIGGYGGNVVTNGFSGATISGGGTIGNENRIGANFATVGGGDGNISAGFAATVGGGERNTSRGFIATVGGGVLNTSSGDYTTVAGGRLNTSSAESATVGGGDSNLSSGLAGTVGGGQRNTNSVNFGTVGGGEDNTSAGFGGTVGGGQHNTCRSSGGTVGGGNYNLSENLESTVGGGSFNISIGDNSTVAGGRYNTSSGDFATVGGGQGNVSSARSATVAGGGDNTSSGWRATVGGGLDNTSSAFAATVGGGHLNEATGEFATIPGGNLNLAGADHTFAAGNRAKAINVGTFVWADSQPVDFSSTASNQFLIRAAGGVGIGTDSPKQSLHNSGDYYGKGHLWLHAREGDGVSGTAYVQARDDSASSSLALQLRTKSGNSVVDVMRLTAGGRVGIGTSTPATALEVVGTVTATAFNPPSDRNLKENFSHISPREVLDKVAGLTITRWNFKGDSATPHLGPMAQDFHAAFGLGTDDKHISTVDADGVALAAIQGLHQVLKEKETEIGELKTRLHSLEKLIQTLVKE